VQYVAVDDFELKDKVVRTVARSRPRDIFGELKTRSSTSPTRRDEKAEQAKKVLNELLGPYGVIVERVSTKDYRFNPAYQRAIEDKRSPIKSPSRTSRPPGGARGVLKKLEDAKGEVNKMVAEADGRFRQAQIEADAYYEKQQRIAKPLRPRASPTPRASRAEQGPGGQRRRGDGQIANRRSPGRQAHPALAAGGFRYGHQDTNINQLLETYGVRSLAGTDDAKK